MDDIQMCKCGDCGGLADIMIMSVRGYYVRCGRCKRATAIHLERSAAIAAWADMNHAISQTDVERLVELAPDVLHDALAKCDMCPQLTRKRPDCMGCYIDDFRQLITRLAKERETTNEREGG